MVPQPYSRMSTPTPVQPFTPPSLTPSQNPTTPGSSHKLRSGLSSSGNIYPSGQSPATPSQLGQYGSARNDTQHLEDLTVETGTTKSGKTYTKPTIRRSLLRFESVLANLVESVSKFRPSVEFAKELIEVDEELAVSIAELVEHQRTAQQLLRLRKVSISLDEQLNTLLVTLADCRRTLRGLPRPDEKYMKAFEQQELQNKTGDKSSMKAAVFEAAGPLGPRVSAQDLLHYATKITKFTSAPPGYNQQAPEHANFPWPTEDEMRRGMLALSAIAGTLDVEPESTTKLVQKSAEPEASRPSGQANGHGETSNGVGMGRRNSLVDYGDQRPDLLNANEGPSTAQLDLDLFDPDDDDDDDEDMEDI